MTTQTTPITDLQQRLIDALAERGIHAAWNGDFLNCRRPVASGKKTKRQRFALVFDGAAELDGPRVVERGQKGAYSQTFARQAFWEALRVGQGQAAADKFAAECRATGEYTGERKQS